MLRSLLNLHLRTFPRTDRAANVGRLECEAVHALLAALQPRQVGANERIAQQVPNRRQDIGRTPPRWFGRKWNQCAKLVARLVFEYGGGRADQRLPEELQDVVLFDVLLEVEHFQIPE